MLPGRPEDKHQQRLICAAATQTQAAGGGATRGKRETPPSDWPRRGEIRRRRARGRFNEPHVFMNGGFHRRRDRPSPLPQPLPPDRGSPAPNQE